MNTNDTAAAVGAAPNRTAQLTAASLLTALLCASAWVAIPAGAVPVTLQMLVVLLAALLLRPSWAAAAVGTYLLLGAIGAPVFSAGQGGMGMLAGPTGGYLVGFLLGSVAGAWVRTRISPRKTAVVDMAAVVTCTVVVYSVGTAWLSFAADLTLPQAIAAGVVPFLALDVVKGMAALVVAAAVRKANVGIAS